MSLSIFIYSNKVEASTTDESKFEAYQAHARNKGWLHHIGESFPPHGFVLAATGQLVVKPEKLRVESGEISLSVLIEAKCEEIGKLCRAKIIGGIVSSALGEPYLYPSDDIDQQNLAAKVISDRDGYFKCTKVSTGIKDWYPHTVAQFKSAFRDGDTYISEMLRVSTLLQKNLREVTTYEGVKNFDKQNY